MKQESDSKSFKPAGDFMPKGMFGSRLLNFLRAGVGVWSGVLFFIFCSLAGARERGKLKHTDKLTVKYSRDRALG
jgi:hypothetical protein